MLAFSYQFINSAQIDQILLKKRQYFVNSLQASAAYNYKLKISLKLPQRTYKISS